MKKLKKSEIVAQDFEVLWNERDDLEVAFLKLACDCPVIRVSSLLGCRRKEHFRAHHAVPQRGASESWPLIQGQIVHAGIAASMPSPGRELRLWHRMKMPQDAGDVVITGRPDFLDFPKEEKGEGLLVVDYKTTGGLLPKEPRSSHLLQLGIYAWLVEQTWGKQPAYLGRIMYSNGRGLLGYEFPLVPAATERVAALAQPLLGKDQKPEGVPVLGDWECNYCPDSGCARHPSNAEEAAPVPADADLPVREPHSRQPAVVIGPGGMPLLPTAERPVVVKDEGDIPF